MDAALLDRARQQFADRNPGSRQYFEQARRHLPGGHTRTVLTHPPFPLLFTGGEGATLTDTDGHQYIDLLGDYTAGLLGHSERRVLDTVTAALQVNVSVGGIHPAEARLAVARCEASGERAKRERKRLYLYLSASDCPFCRKYEAFLEKNAAELAPQPPSGAWFARKVTCSSSQILSMSVIVRSGPSLAACARISPSSAGASTSASSASNSPWISPTISSGPSGSD